MFAENSEFRSSAAKRQVTAQENLYIFNIFLLHQDERGRRLEKGISRSLIIA